MSCSYCRKHDFPGCGFTGSENKAHQVVLCLEIHTPFKSYYLQSGQVADWGALSSCPALLSQHPKCLLQTPGFSQHVSPLSSLNCSRLWAALPFPQQLINMEIAILAMCFLYLFGLLVPSLPFLSNSPPPSSHSLVYSVGHIQSSTFSLCSVLFQMALAELFFIASIKTLSSTIPRSSHVFIYTNPLCFMDQLYFLTSGQRCDFLQGSAFWK